MSARRALRRVEQFIAKTSARLDARALRRLKAWLTGGMSDAVRLRYERGQFALDLRVVAAMAERAIGRGRRKLSDYERLFTPAERRAMERAQHGYAAGKAVT